MAGHRFAERGQIGWAVGGGGEDLGDVAEVAGPNTPGVAIARNFAATLLTLIAIAFVHSDNRLTAALAMGASPPK